MRTLSRFLIQSAFLLVMGNLYVSAAAPTVSERWVLRKIHFAGNKTFDNARLQAETPLKSSKTFTTEKIDFSVGRIAAFYRQNGYWDIAITTTVAKLGLGNQADIAFLIDEGPLYALGRVNIEGNRLIEDKVILRELKVVEYKPFSQTQFYQGHQRLFLTGYFDSIDLIYSTTTNHQVNVEVKVVERATRYLKGSVGYGAESKERFSLGAEDANFLGNGRRLELKGTMSGFVTNPSKYKTRRIELNFRQPYVFNSETEGLTSLSREWNNRDSYDSIATLWESSLGKRFSKDITARMRYRFEGTRLTRVTPEAVTDQGRFTSISALGPMFIYDNTNDPFLPMYGWRINSYYEKGLSFWAGDLDFHKSETKVGRFETFWKKWTAFAGLQFGLQRTDHTRDSMPIFERFTLGGANTVRGYGERDLGPTDVDGNPLGGDAYGVFNLEVRHPIYKLLHGVAFLDGGQLWDKEQGDGWPSIVIRKKDDLRYGAGGGIRLMTPVGAIRLEMGYKLNPPPGFSGFKDRTAIHFSIGEVF